MLIEVYIPKYFFLHAASLHQGFPHCAIFPTAASRRSLGRVSVPMWPITLSSRLLIVALVGRYLTNKLIRRGSILYHRSFFTPYHAVLCAYAVLAVVSNCYPPVQGRLPTRYSPVRHSVTMVFLPKDSVQGASFDLHVLSTPPAFILSQDQTLVKSVCSVRMTLAIHPLLLFWKSLASITRINNVRSENFIFEFSGMVAVQLSMFLFAVSLRQLVYYISLAVACQQLFYFSFSRISVVFSTARIIYHNFLCLSTTF